MADALDALLATFRRAGAMGPEPFHSTWLAVAKQRRADDLPRLVESVVATTSRSGNAVVAAFGERVDALVRLPDDPRWGPAVIGLLRSSSIFGATSKHCQPAWTRLFDRVIDNGEREDLARFAKLDFKRLWRGWNDVAGRIAFLTAETTRVREALAAGAPAPKRTVVTPKPRKRATSTVRDRDAELRDLVEGWRTTRAPRIAALIDELTAQRTLRVADHRSKEPREALQRAWLELAERGDPLDLPRLLLTITDTHFRATDALARANALAERYAAADPRIARGVLRRLERIPFHASSTRPFWTAMFALAVAHGDHGTAKALDALAKRFPAILRERYAPRTAEAKWFASRARAAAAELRRTPAGPDELPPHVAQIAEKLARTRAITRELVASCEQAPRDPGPRQVLADHLMEQGDPRGELVAHDTELVPIRKLLAR